MIYDCFFVDLPMVISQKHIAIIDPHKNCIKPKSETSPAGTKKKLSSFFKHAGHISTFESVFGLDTSKLIPDGTYNGTIFRFPLRQPNSGSKISETSYTPEKIQSTLFESLKEESPYILLFLRHVKSISLKEWKEGYSQPHETFRVEASDQKAVDISRAVSPSIEQFARQYSQSSEDGDLQVSIELKSKTVTISDSIRGSPESHHWLVLKVVGTNDSELDKLGKELSILPWVGLATRLPQQIALYECSASTTDPFDNHSTVEAIFKQQLQTSLLKSRVSMNWPTNPADNAPGHAYCFLPLPESTAMPVHVHGYFAVTDNRRSIKWPMHDEKGKEAQWNKELLYKMVAPAYSLLLSSRASLIRYEDTPLPITNTKHMTDPYSTWPLYPEVKNVHIWNELVSPTVGFSCSLPLLWTPACGGKWIQFNEAYFVPGSFTECAYSCSRVIVQMLVKLDTPVVGLPTSICETIKQNGNLMDLVRGKEISPQFVREMLGKNPQYCSSLTKEEIYDMLKFVLTDLNYSNYDLLCSIPLLPLKDTPGVVTFQRPAYAEAKYIFPPSSQSLLDIVPGADSLIVDPELPGVVAEKLREIANSGCLQVKKVDTVAMCRQLLPKSVNSWCTVISGNGRKWTPGCNSHPLQSWMDALWRWIAETKVSLSTLEELPIVPQFVDHQSNEVVLLKVSRSVNMCRISATFSARERTPLISILKKLSMLIVDSSKMNDCQKLNQHPDFESYVPELSQNLELIVKYLSKLNNANRLQIVQQLDNAEKDFLRKQFYSLCDLLCRQYQYCLQSIPIYHAACSSALSPTYISLNGTGNYSSPIAFLPPDNIPQLPDQPSNMLCPATTHEEKSFLQTLAVKQLSISELCSNHLIQLALRHIQGHPNSWSIGDDLVMWILKQQPQSVESVLYQLSNQRVIYARNGTHKLPKEVYDPQDQTLTILFDINNDRGNFPDERYMQEAHYRQALRKMGMKTWEDFQNDQTLMRTMLNGRMNSIRTLQPPEQMIRGQFILQLLANDHNLQQYIIGYLNGIQFLKAEVCPSSYPSCLKGMWCGRNGRLYSIGELASPDGQPHNLIGTAMPILSSEYCSGKFAVHMSAFEQLTFKKSSVAYVQRHLQNLQSSNVQALDDNGIGTFDQIVISVYDYLRVNASELNLPYIWWRAAEPPQFLSANKFVQELPADYQMSLEPFYYCLIPPMRRYTNLFKLHDPLAPADLAEIVRTISRRGVVLSSHDINLCVSIFNWLCERGYTETGMLMITEDNKLISAMGCVYDDRGWTKRTESQGHIKGKRLHFVHHQITQRVAKHFEVVPLSCKVAPSQKLNISYEKTGPHEGITDRIKRIVEDYKTNIDIFKELIQNADDAEAEEVKFLIDWREHPQDSLISEELKEWQGPALVVYNSATFSDEDFKNICKVAGETKKRNPLKTGRFGVGFCAMYRLTDVPSFISRKYFTMFDPHTSYLKDRISPHQPGMRVDLVENQLDLALLQDQFKPYESVFGCNVFSLSRDGYQGTIFRFPFRSQTTSANSQICEAIYDRKLVAGLVHSLKEQGENLLLFLKHVKKVSLYKLEKGEDPSRPSELFSVERTASSSALKRVNLIKNYSHPTLYYSPEPCSDKFDVTVKDDKKSSLRTCWIVSSAIKRPSQSLQHDLDGLLPLAEVAVRLDPSKDDPGFYVPSNKHDMGKVFCFLPLPIRSGLPFHVNGFFSIGKDRRNISATVDGTPESLWNKSLAEGALVLAFITLLQRLTSESNLQGLSSPAVKKEYLQAYYWLWKMKDAEGLVGSSFATAFKQCVPTVTHSILWSELNGGRWLSPVYAVVFKDSKLKDEKPIAEDAIALLLKNSHGVVDLPGNVYEMLKSSLKKGEREYNYEKFCQEIFFPRIAMLDQGIRDRHVLFLLEKTGEYSYGSNPFYEWAEKLLKETSCIRCQHTNVLRVPSQLISSANDLFKKLYNVTEGRFPNEDFQKSPNAIQGLTKLGMASSKLNFPDLKERAESIARLPKELALERSLHVCEYIDSAYGPKYFNLYTGLKLNDQDKKELQQLLHIPFLSVKQKPQDVDVPWYGIAQQFDSPIRVYSADCEHLVFSQHPVVELDSKKLLRLLEIGSKRPTPDIVLAHLRCIVNHVRSNPNDTTVQFLNSSMKEVYRYFQNNLISSSQLVQSGLVQIQKFIWQDGCFLRPDQVLRYWRQKCIPYMCELSSENSNFIVLWSTVGVKDGATMEILVDILQRIASDHGIHTPISDEVLKFVVFVAGELYYKLVRCNKIKDHSFKIYLPDKSKIMRITSELADNFNEEYIKNFSAYQQFKSSGSGYFVHESIPRDHAIGLGVVPLLDAVVKEFEDDSFLKGTDFGQKEQLCDRLNGILKQYPSDSSIFKEFIQNADDAQATEIIFILDHRSKFPDNKLLCSESNWKSLQKSPALCVFNNRKFTEADIEGITKLGKGSKSESAELIGKFGIGFNVAYHVTDCPSFVSYSENGSPEYLCVFDPTRSFVARLAHQSPGRKWIFKGKKEYYSEFSEQFEPYLAEDLSNLAEQSPYCLQTFKSHGYVVFRLPLTRHSGIDTGTLKLRSGRRFSPIAISDLLKEFATDSQDLLLFLNHLQSVSAFEIKEDGSFIHHFTTRASVPSQDVKKHEKFSTHVKRYSDALRTVGAVEPVSLTHRMNVTCIQHDNSVKESQWLVQRMIGGRGLPVKLLRDGLEEGLRPIGGVATLIKPLHNYKYSLFCFLPLPIQSNLPIHVNGHFSVDVSRKHFESTKQQGLENWNASLAQEVIVPAYVDLIMEAKSLVLDTADDSEWFYSLFPRVAPPDAESDTTAGVANIGELTNLNIVHSFYGELLRRDSSILIREMPQPTPCPTWMPLRDCLFSVTFVAEQTRNELTVVEELRSALVSLGMKVTIAPNYIYEGCSAVEDNFKVSAIIHPDKIVDHLQRLQCSEEHKETIKTCIQPLLQYCISGYPPQRVRSLFETALYLIAKDGSLQRGCLFMSHFSELLPHCSNRFVDSKLEESSVGQKLLEKNYNVIRAIPLEFVSSNIQLPTTTAACSLNQSMAKILQQLWTYISTYPGTLVNVPEELKKLFHWKPVIPTSDGQVYPLCKSKMLVRDAASENDLSSVMKRLGYPQIDFGKIELDDKTRKQLLTIINELTSSFIEGQEIIDCFLLQPPSNFDIQLSNDEALHFLSSLAKLKNPQNLSQISGFLLNMPLFKTIDESRITLQGISRVYILSNTASRVPLSGVPTSNNGQVVLKTADSESLKCFYDAVIPANKKIYVESEGFYVQIVLPILPNLDESSIKEHVQYLHLNRGSMTTAFDLLKETPFIYHNGKKYKVKELCDPRIKFFTTFKQEYVLPPQWHNEMVVMESLGLQMSVTTDEWLKYARIFSTELGSKIEHKSKVLFEQLIQIINSVHTMSEDFSTFLKKVSDIPFIYSPEKWDLNQILSYIFPSGSQGTSLTNNMVKFRESVSFHEADNACLCRSVLPEHCQSILNNNTLRQALFIESPLALTTVAENLLCICSRMNTSCARPQRINPQILTNLIKIIEKHYAALNVTLQPDITTKLRDTMCILPSRKSALLQLVKPSQLVMHLPHDCFLEPYCYEVESWLQAYGLFLTSVGVRQKLTAQDYVDILFQVKAGLEDDGGTHGEGNEESCMSENESKVIESAYRELIQCLRQGDTLKEDTVLNLPDENLRLTEVSDLCLNDVPWYKSRLTPDCGLKFILQPPADSERNRTLPDILSVKRLSHIVTETLEESCKATAYRCKFEGLFAAKKRSEDDRCVFVKNILETLKSDKLIEGFCRMYYTQYKRAPPESFKQLVQNLKDVEVHCVQIELKSVLRLNGSTIPGTEDTTKLCHICRNSDGTSSLYISPHRKSVDDGELAPFFKDLAVCIGKLIDNIIENMVPIAAIFECRPHEIPLALTREQVHEYSEVDVKPTKASIIGTPVPWSKLPPQDSLIIVNFKPKDRVRFLDDSGSLVNADIVQADGEGLQNMKLTVKVKETEIKNNDDNDTDDIDSEDDRPADDTSLLDASPMQVFKVLDSYQRKSLWSEGVSQFACPIVLETVPSEDSDKLLEWLDEIFNSSAFTSCSELIQCVFILRLLGHIYYQLVTQKKNSTLFREAALMLQEKFPQSSEQMCSLLKEIIRKSETAGLVPESAKSIFPSKELEQVLEMSTLAVPAVAMNDQGVLPKAQQPAPGGQVGGGGGGAHLPQAGQPQITPAPTRYATPKSAKQRRGHRNPRYPVQTPPQDATDALTASPRQIPPPDTCMPSATAWLEQAKADYNAAESLLHDSVIAVNAASSPDPDAGGPECKYPALVCFLCHDTVEKCIKAVLYAFCGLDQSLVNNSSLVMLKDALSASPHHPKDLLDPINECVNTINKHENMSRFPNYRHYPPCAPASTYYTSDAKEAFSATTKLLHHLQSEAPLNQVLMDLGQLPAKRFMSALQSPSDDQGMFHINGF